MLMSVQGKTGYMQSNKEYLSWCNIFSNNAPLIIRSTV